MCVLLKIFEGGFGKIWFFFTSQKNKKKVEQQNAKKYKKKKNSPPTLLPSLSPRLTKKKVDLKYNSPLTHKKVFQHTVGQVILVTKKVANCKKTPKIRQFYLVAKFLVQLYAINKLIV